MSVGSCMITFGSAFAPVATGGLVSSLGWHGIFIIPLVTMVVLLVAGIPFMHDMGANDVHLDVVSVGLSAVFLFTLSYGLAQLLSSPMQIAIMLAICIASTIVFAIRQLRSDNPLIDLSPMKRIEFWPTIALVSVAMMRSFSLSALLPLYLESALGMEAFMAGMVMLVPALANAGTTLIGGRIMDRSGEWPLIPIGFATATVGLALHGMIAASDALVAVGSADGATAREGIDERTTNVLRIKLEPWSKRHGKPIVLNGRYGARGETGRARWSRYNASHELRTFDRRLRGGSTMSTITTLAKLAKMATKNSKDVETLIKTAGAVVTAAKALIEEAKPILDEVDTDALAAKVRTGAKTAAEGAGKAGNAVKNAAGDAAGTVSMALSKTVSTACFKHSRTTACTVSSNRLQGRGAGALPLKLSETL